METCIRRDIAWEELEALQQECVQRVARNPLDSYLLICEPRPTFTYGRSSRPEELLHPDPTSIGVDVQPADRGGRWTYHGPGQLVVYPIAYLPRLGYPKRAARRFVCDLAGSVILFLQSHGLEARTGDNPFGVYLPQGKVASFGINLRKGISSHGLALYLASQQDAFRGIVPCGASQTRIASLHEAGSLLQWERAANELSDYIKRGFQLSKN